MQTRRRFTPWEFRAQEGPKTGVNRRLPLLPRVAILKTKVGPAYALRVGPAYALSSTLDIPFTENFERHNEAERFVPIKRIEGDSCKPAVDAVCDRILRHSDCSSYPEARATKRRL